MALLKSNITQRKQGAVMMETVMVMPIFLLIIFGIFHSAHLWLTRLMVEYAAYCAARSTLVYHPDDYSESVYSEIDKKWEVTFLATSGVAHESASLVLAWIAFSSGERRVSIPGWGEIPMSGDIGGYVTINTDTSSETLDPHTVTVQVDFTTRLLFPLYAFLQNPKEPELSVTVSAQCTLPKPQRTDLYPRNKVIELTNDAE